MARNGWGIAATTVVCVAAGYLLAVSGATADGSDLRPQRDTNLVELVKTRSERVEQLRHDAEKLRGEIDELRPLQGDGIPSEAVDQAGIDAMTRPVAGPGVTVTLTDAPVDVKPAGIDEDLLVVHQQDIQQVANALWAAGAEAMTIQGQRVVATTAVKCVGNTVVLHGVPYAPPYVIAAIGDQDGLMAGLDTDEYVRIYRDYAARYQLGYDAKREQHIDMPAYRGSLTMTRATPRR